MHPFCCVSTAPVGRNPTSSSRLTEFLDMPLPPQPSSAVRSNSLRAPASRRDSVDLSNGHSRSRPPNLHRSRSLTGPRDPSPLVSGDQREVVQLNDVVGNGISGILYKWVNYGKGWRPRWFVLQDGVLSYYKIHGRDKIEVTLETEKGSKVIGEESLKRIGRHKNGHSLLPRKPFGEVHLKVGERNSL